LKPTLLPLAALALAAGLLAADPPPPAKDGQALPKSVRPAEEAAAAPAATLAALKKELELVTADRVRDLKSAKTRADEQKVWERYRSRHDTVVARAIDLARTNPRDPASFEALEWVLAGHIGWGPTTDPAFGVLTKDHLNSDKLEAICLNVALYFETDSGERFLRAVLDKNPHRSVRGVACLSLGRQLYYAAARARYDKRPEADRLLKESEQHYERVVAEFADVQSKGSPIVERAKAALFEIRYLAIGKPAPDIAGEDVDGKSFKLSDYRGKVVVLDFWGHW
jgi:hypothetical protein